MTEHEAASSGSARRRQWDEDCAPHIYIIYIYIQIRALCARRVCERFVRCEDDREHDRARGEGSAIRAHDRKSGGGGGIGFNVDSIGASAGTRERERLACNKKFSHTL